MEQPPSPKANTKHFRFATWISIIAIGIILIIAAALQLKPEAIESYVILNIGSMLLGTGFGFLMAELRQFDQSRDLQQIHQDLYGLIEKSVPPGLFAAENKVEPCRSKFHHYHLTHINNSYVWRYAVIDFTIEKRPHRLLATCFWPDPDEPNIVHHYQVEATPSRHRLCLFIEPVQGDEDTQVEIYPRAAKEDMGAKGGLAFLESPSGDKIVGPCILSTKPLVKEIPSPGLLNPDQGLVLDKEWLRVFPKTVHHVMLPPGYSTTDPLRQIN